MSDAADPSHHGAVPDKRADTSTRRLDQIFGRDLGTADDPDADDRSSDHATDERSRERWYRENRPPHHDEA